jgi:hypothetical protein
MKLIQAERLARDDAWQAYRTAFADLARKARNMQSLREQQNADQAAIDAALLEVEKASLVYRNCRDALAHYLLPPSVHGRIWGEQVNSSQLAAARVRNIAKLRWEMRGKPEGTANDDWNRAEEIIRRTAAA